MHIVVVANNTIFSPKGCGRAMDDSLLRMENAVAARRRQGTFSGAIRFEPLNGDVKID
jgi:hypothetical protein